MTISDRINLHRAASLANEAGTRARTITTARAANALYAYCVRVLAI